jgi:hypothetical protein
MGWSIPGKPGGCGPPGFLLEQEITEETEKRTLFYFLRGLLNRPERKSGDFRYPLPIHARSLSGLAPLLNNPSATDRGVT